MDLHFSQLDCSPATQGFIKVQHGNIGKVGNLSNGLEKPKLLNGSFIKELIQKETSNIVQDLTQTMSPTTFTTSNATVLHLLDGLIG
jgi:hypothetical protein